MTARGDQAVILAGGLGTRMQRRCEAIPKFLLPVSGRPFAAWLLARLAGAGFAEALICIGHLGEAIRRAVGDGRSFGIPVRYADEGEELLGTAGALRSALPCLGPTFLVTYGDSFLPFDYRAPLFDLRAHPEASGTMAVYRNRDQFDRSNTAIKGSLVLQYDKRPPSAPPDPALDHIDYGAMALRREVIEALPEGEVVGLDSLQRSLALSGRLRALCVEQRFFEIGSEEGLGALEAALSQDPSLGAPSEGSHEDRS